MSVQMAGSFILDTQTQRRRVLFIDPKIHYRNSTYRRFSRAFDLAFNVVRYGPDYGAIEEFEANLSDIIQSADQSLRCLFIPFSWCTDW